MVKQMQDKRGYTLIELLICIYIISVLGLLFLPTLKPFTFNKERFVIEALLMQSEAMKEMEDRNIWEDGIELRYTSEGHISQAHTFVFENHEITAFLGWGRLCEK